MENKSEVKLSFMERVEVARKTVNFPQYGVALFMAISGIFVLFEFINYLPIIKTFQAGAYALAAFVLLIGFIVTMCLLIDVALIILPPIFTIFFPLKKVIK